MSMDDAPITNLGGHESDPEKVQQGQNDFHKALFDIQHLIDPAYSFILHRFNRVGIEHDQLDTTLFMDADDTPCIGVNFEKYHEELNPLARIGMIEHSVGHLMCGHLGNRLGYELREYCELKYGPTAGSSVYYLTVETAADCFVSYPGALHDSNRPFYDIRKLGLERYAPTVEILRKIEEQVPPSDDENAMLDQLQNLANMMNDSDTDWDGEPLDLQEGGGSGEGSNGQGEKQQDAASSDSGVIKTKDLIANGDKSDALNGEDKVRTIISEALKNTDGVKSRGFMGGDASQFIDSEDAQPKVPWYQRMNAAVSARLSEERRMSKLRLNRRSPYCKGRTYENTTNVVFVIDTSASMRSQELSRVNSEVDAIAQNTDFVTVIHCDSSVAKQEEYRRGMSLNKFFGRGGTTFTPALQHIFDNLQGDSWPSIVVYFTDGYGEPLDVENPMIRAFASNLLWILTPSGMDEDDFIDNYMNGIGDVIKIEEW